MAVIGVDVQVRIGGVIAAFERLRKADFRKVFRALRRPANQDQKDHKIKEEGPQGHWPALASTTKARYARLGYRKNRRLLARLPSALTSKVTGDSLTIKSRVRWSMAHQAGAVVGHGSRLPQRQFLWASEPLLKRVSKEFRTYLFRIWFS